MPEMSIIYYSYTPPPAFFLAGDGEKKQTNGKGTILVHEIVAGSNRYSRRHLLIVRYRCTVFFFFSEATHVEELYTGAPKN